MKVFIASVYPFRQTAERQYSASHETPGAWTTFVMEPGTKDKPFVLAVEDHWEKVYLSADVPSERRVVFGFDVAQDLIRQFTNNTGTDQGFGPGIGIIAGPEPTAEEIERLVLTQQAWEIWLVEQGDMAHQEGRLDKIGALNRWAAHNLGIQDKPWITPIVAKEMINCPLCTSRIAAEAIFCPKCQQQVKEIPKNLRFASAGAAAAEKK